MKKHVFTTKMVCAVDSAAPASVWGKSVPGKGGMTTNSAIIEKTKKEDE